MTMCRGARCAAAARFTGALLLSALGLTLAPHAAPGKDSRPASAGGTTSRPATGAVSPEPAAAEPVGPEPRLRNIRQLTFGGENAEAYFSFDGTRLSFQTTRPPFDCDQIFTMKLDGSDLRQVSSGKGRTTCAYFYPDGRSLLYASTHLAGDACPPRPSFSKGYVWGIYESYDIFRVDLSGTVQQRLTDAPGYDAEATIAPDGSRIIFTSDRDGDLELYSMDLDGSNVKRLTHTPGYDGGAFYSPDSKQICYRAHHPTDVKELADYQGLLKEHLVRPSKLSIMVADADGSNPRAVVTNGAANFAPFFHPSGRKIVFATNMGDPRGRNFDIFMVNTDGTGIEQITRNESFDGFPMFSPDGKRLVFSSNRNAAKVGETNVFIADWVEELPPADPGSGH